MVVDCNLADLILANLVITDKPFSLLQHPLCKNFQGCVCLCEGAFDAAANA